MNDSVLVNIWGLLMVGCFGTRLTCGRRNSSTVINTLPKGAYASSITIKNYNVADQKMQMVIKGNEIRIFYDMYQRGKNVISVFKMYSYLGKNADQMEAKYKNVVRVFSSQGQRMSQIVSQHAFCK